MLLLAVGIEVRLYTYDVVVVIHIERTQPAVIGAEQIYVLIPEPYTDHDGRDKYIARTRQSAAASDGKMFEPCETFDTDRIEAFDAYAWIVDAEHILVTAYGDK